MNLICSLYNLENKKLTIGRDVEIDENSSWNWEEEKVEKRHIPISKQQPQEEQEVEETIEDTSTPLSSPQQHDSSPDTTPRRVKSLVDIYQTCNIAMLEPECYEKASKQKVWVKAMEEEIKMIEKNNTWELVDCPYGKDIIGVKWYKTS